MSVVQRFAVVLCLAATGACASSSEKGAGPVQVVSINPDFRVDNAKADAGGEVWRTKACFVCHTVGDMGSSARGTAPDLGGVAERREIAWIKQFLLHTEQMIDADPIANALWKQYNMQRMPNMHVTEEQAENLIHYLQQQTEKKRAS
jgi:mono/diheme cytochrome c family protein